MLELTWRDRVRNRVIKAGEAWQVTIGRDLEGLTLVFLALAGSANAPPRSGKPLA